MFRVSKELKGGGGGGILLLGRSSFHPFVMLFDALHNVRTVHTTVLKFFIWIPHEKIADRYFFLGRIMTFS